MASWLGHTLERYGIMPAVDCASSIVGGPVRKGAVLFVRNTEESFYQTLGQGDSLRFTFTNLPPDASTFYLNMASEQGLITTEVSSRNHVITFDWGQIEALPPGAYFFIFRVMLDAVTVSIGQISALIKG